MKNILFIVFVQISGLLFLNGCTSSPEVESSLKSVKTFSFSCFDAKVQISDSSHTIVVSVPFGTNVTSLTPIITFAGTSIYPQSEVPQDFSNPVIYTITAEDKSTQSYLVTVTVQSPNYSYKVGDTGLAGGLIFYDKGNYSDGWRYMEASPFDVSISIQWYNGDYSLTGAVGTDIGSGASNTDLIVESQGDGNYAAMICSNLNTGGYDDWFLPSKDELNEMYVNLYQKRVGDFNCTWYWSSSEESNYKAYIQIFEYGGQDGFDKSEPVYKIGVRAARRF